MIRLSKEKIAILFLSILLFAGFIVRLYRFNGSIADWHSWRQADTSAVSRNFVQSGFDLLHPQFDDLSNVPSGLDNPNGYRFVEFPIYNLFQAGLSKASSVLTLEEWGRMVTIVASLFSSLFLFFLVKKRFGNVSALLTTFFFLFLPFNIYYSRTILPDPSMVTAILGGTYFFDKWLEKAKPSILSFQFLLSLLFTAVALLLKPYALFFTLPMIYLAFEKFGLSFLRKWQLWLFLIISVVPLALWRIWMTQFPAGIPVSAWLLNGGNIRFKGAFFYWIFADRIGRLISGYWGVAFIILGMLGNYTKKNFLFLLSFVISSLLYITVIARGNVQHDYYQILIIPSLAILMGVGAASLLEKIDGYKKYVNYTVLLVGILFTVFFGWYFARDYFNINNPAIVIAGEAVDKLIPKNAKIIANYGGDTSFLYQTKRKGWASFEKSIPEMVQMGAGYLVLANPTTVDLGLGKTYKIISQTAQYVIFDLRQNP
jgi:4-amino-4-deoxy-L-arabinose transferase-like glycosyltransferase